MRVTVAPWTRLLGVFPLALATGAVACGGAEPVEEQAVAVVHPPRVRYGNLNKATYRAETTDLNQDGAADQTRYFTGPTLALAERDLDFDGRVDFFEYYDSVGAIVEQELQLDFDEQIDIVRVFDGGVLAREEFMTGFDTTASLFKYFDTAGNVLWIARDSDGNGVVDFFGYYEGNQIVRVGIDSDGDGRPDDVEAYE